MSVIETKVPIVAGALETAEVVVVRHPAENRAASKVALTNAVTEPAVTQQKAITVGGSIERASVVVATSLAVPGTVAPQRSPGGGQSSQRLPSATTSGAAPQVKRYPNFWYPIGPASQQSGNTFWSGRTDAFEFTPNFDGNGTPALYLGAADGGLWRTTNFQSAAPDWVPLIDRLPLPLGDLGGLNEVSSITVDPFNPKSLYAAGGYTTHPDSKNEGYGTALLKSTDAGATWKPTARSTFSNSGFPSITRIIIDPTAASPGKTLFVCGGADPISRYRTVMRSDDGALSFTTYTRNLPPSFVVDDLDYTVVGNSTLLFAGVRDPNTPVTVTTPGIWSINASSAGSTWTQMNIDLRDLSNKQYAPTQIGLIKLAIDRNNNTPFGAFAVVQSIDGSLLNVFKLVSGMWIPTGFGIPVGTRADATLSMCIAQSGAIFVAGGAVSTSTDWVFRSSDGGSSWTPALAGKNMVRPHGDFRILAGTGGMVLIGTDGGVWRFDESTGNWVDMNSWSLQTHRLYSIDVSPNDESVVLTGTQDSGVAALHQDVWTAAGGDDTRGVRFSRDPIVNGQVAYSISDSSRYNILEKSIDGGVSFFALPDFPIGTNIPFSSRMALHPSKADILVVGFDVVMRSTDGGNTFTIISPAFGIGMFPYNVITSLVYTERAIYAGFTNSLFYTTNAGGTWADLRAPIQSIALAIDDATSGSVPHVYVGDGAGRVFRTIVPGFWEDMKGDLPNVAVNALALLSNPGADPWVFAATSLGVYATVGKQPDGSVHWSLFGSNLPAVPCNDLHISPNSRTLYVATFGRGAWISSIGSTL